jgi:hypothetical protein
MVRSFSVGLVFWAVGLSFVDRCVAADPVATVESPTKKETTAKKTDVKKPRGRLPAHYGQVVSEKQRETIYGIQAEYAAKIEVLETQLKTLKAERDKRMAAVLTAEQQKKVEDATAKARTKRAKPVEQAAASKASAIKSGPDR